MPTIRITKASVDSLTSGTGTRLFYDRDLKGFGVRVSPGGHKCYIVEYRPGAGGRGVRSKRMKIGDANVFTAEQARQTAKTILANARLGTDLADERERERLTPTVTEFSEIFMRDHVEMKLAGRTIATYADHFHRLIRPSLGNMKLNRVTVAEVAKLHLKIGRENGHGMSNRTMQTLSSMFGYAIRLKLLPKHANPVADIERFDESSVERYLSSDEIAAIGASLLEGETVGLPWRLDPTKPNRKHVAKANQRTLLDPFSAAAIRLLLLTGCRSGEVLNLQWKHVDLERGLLLLPTSKTGKKTVILSGPALMVLADLPRVGPYVIPGKDPTKPRNNFRKAWTSVVLHAGIEWARIHDLRHTHASFGIGAGVGLSVIGKLLGHLSTATTARYAHLADNPARQAAELIGAGLAAAIQGENVIPLRRNTA